MELLLNVLWGTLALAAFYAVMRTRQSFAGSASVSTVRCMLAAACVLILLFPVISASDDLHPTQNLFEDSSKRTQPTVAPPIHAVPAFAMLMLMLTWLLGCFAVQYLVSLWMGASTLAGERSAVGWRAPPILSN